MRSNGNQRTPQCKVRQENLEGKKLLLLMQDTNDWKFMGEAYHLSPAVAISRLMVI